jgi:menaquinone-dependent protoporphyrinogen oxidase
MTDKRVLVAYASKRGSARQAAEWIAEELGDCCDLVNLQGSRKVNLQPYQVVVLGSGILAGSVYKPLKKFIKARNEELAGKDICLFITHIAEGEEIEKDFRSAFEEEFLARARVREGLGGRLKLGQLNFFLRLIMKKIEKEAGKDYSDYDNLSHEACVNFAHKVRERCLESNNG